MLLHRCLGQSSNSRVLSSFQCGGIRGAKRTCPEGKSCRSRVRRTQILTPAVTEKVRRLTWLCSARADAARPGWQPGWQYKGTSGGKEMRLVCRRSSLCSLWAYRLWALIHKESSTAQWKTPTVNFLRHTLKRSTDSRQTMTVVVGTPSSQTDCDCCPACCTMRAGEGSVVLTVMMTKHHSPSVCQSPACSTPPAYQTSLLKQT